MSPKKERQSGKEIKAGGGAPHCSHQYNGISSLDCNRQALPQVGERLGFPGDLFEMATQFSQERESLGPKRVCCLNGHWCEVMAVCEGCNFPLFNQLANNNCWPWLTTRTHHILMTITLLTHTWLQNINLKRSMHWCVQPACVSLLQFCRLTDTYVSIQLVTYVCY